MRLSNQRLGLADDLIEVFPARKALGVDLVDILSAAGAGGKPAVLGDIFSPPIGALLPGRG